jgi:hypothetical protein
VRARAAIRSRGIADARTARRGRVTPAKLTCEYLTSSAKVQVPELYNRSPGRSVGWLQLSKCPSDAASLQYRRPFYRRFLPPDFTFSALPEKIRSLILPTPADNSNCISLPGKSRRISHADHR